MTKRQRAKVVELLRCAADRSWGSALPFSNAVYYVGAPLEIEKLAYRAWRRVYNAAVRDGTHRPLGAGSEFVSLFSTLLEAAARVEEGSFP